MKEVRIFTLPNILVTNNYGENQLKIIRSELPPGFELITLNKFCKKELMEKVQGVDYLLVGGRIPIDRGVLNCASSLKMVQRTGVGIDNVDLEAIREKKIPLYINYGINSQSVAEHTILLILSVLRRLPEADSSIKKGIWLKHELGVGNIELYGKEVGLIGLGNIGIKVSQILRAIGAKIYYYKPTRLSVNEEKELNVFYKPKNSLLKEVDILSLHCPLNEKTKGLISKQELHMMKPGAVIINTSRGGLIDEKDLLNCLQSGHIAGAGLDVYSQEPLSENHPLLKMNNVVLTPHLGGITKESFTKLMRKALQNIYLYEKGQLDELETSRVKY